MKEKEVYVVIIDDVCDYEQQTDAVVLSTLESAKAEMERLKLSDFDKSQKDFILDEWDMGFSYYLDGDHTSNHFDVQIVKRVVL
mgnify:CR=1 FL=1